MKKKYFHNLNGLRFALAFFAVLEHIEALKYWNGFESIFKTSDFVSKSGPVAISYFFVLSGFLISYFLMVEKDGDSKTIHTRNFYIKRFLRIWPLYFVTLLLFFFILPNLPFGSIMEAFKFKDLVDVKNAFHVPAYVYVILSVLFLPQVGMAISTISRGAPMPGGHMWSIGVEELFYISWPLLLKKTNNVKRLLIKIAVIYFCLVFSFIVLYVLNDKIWQIKRLDSIANISILVLYLTRIVCMLIGIYGAYIYINNPTFLKKHFTLLKARIALVIIIAMLYKGVDGLVFVQEIFSVLFLYILLYLVQEGNKFVFLENKFMSYLGKISYGIYMYHMFAISFVLYYLKSSFLNVNTPFGNIVLYVGSFVVAILIAMFSYHLFELKFMKLRKRYVK